MKGGALEALHKLIRFGAAHEAVPHLCCICHIKHQILRSHVPAGRMHTSHSHPGTHIAASHQSTLLHALLDPAEVRSNRSKPVSSQWCPYDQKLPHHPAALSIQFPVVTRKRVMRECLRVCRDCLNMRWTNIDFKQAFKVNIRENIVPSTSTNVDDECEHRYRQQQQQ